MFANSRSVSSSQCRPHPGLHALIARHQQHPLQRPITPASRDYFAKLNALLTQQAAPIIIDAGCGTGAGSLKLARLYPEHWIIGIDKSAQRLARSGVRDHLLQRDNCVLLRMQLEDFYPLHLTTNRPVAHQYFLYPNPWPKAKHLQRRWHAHGLFPLIMQTGGIIELRSNWLVYAREFIAGLSHYPDYHTELLSHTPAGQPTLSPFETKYAASGHPLYRCVATPVGYEQPE
ncbi:MAG: tRNA (guanine(46)-N(7))-methyltransferase TrmB [Gammaproteobacteria bacterium]